MSQSLSRADVVRDGVALVRNLLSQMYVDVGLMCQDVCLHEQILLAAQKLEPCLSIYIIGTGKSHHIASKTASTMNTCGIKAYAPTCEELLHGSVGRIGENNGVLILSKSGTTDEILKILSCIPLETLVIVITANPNITPLGPYYFYISLSRDDEYDYLNLLPTRTATTTMIICDLLVACLAQMKKKTYNDMSQNHPSGHVGKVLLQSCQDNFTIMNQEIFPIMDGNH